MLKKIAFAVLLSTVVVFTLLESQVVQCTDGGCTVFAEECTAGGGDVVCYNAHSNVEEASPKQIRDCEHWNNMTARLCDGDLPANQPCLNAEKMMLEKCTYVPTTVCIADPNTIPELVLSGPDVCKGDCTEVLEQLSDPEGEQPTCTIDFQ